MKTTRKIIIDLSPTELEEAVSLYLMKSGWHLKGITFNVETVTTGYGMAERDEQKFTGATAEVTTKITDL